MWFNSNSQLSHFITLDYLVELSDEAKKNREEIHEATRTKVLGFLQELMKNTPRNNRIAYRPNKMYIPSTVASKIRSYIAAELILKSYTLQKYNKSLEECNELISLFSNNIIKDYICVNVNTEELFKHINSEPRESIFLRSYISKMADPSKLLKPFLLTSYSEKTYNEFVRAAKRNYIAELNYFPQLPEQFDFNRIMLDSYNTMLQKVVEIFNTFKNGTESDFFSSIVKFFRVFCEHLRFPKNDYTTYLFLYIFRFFFELCSAESYSFFFPLISNDSEIYKKFVSLYSLRLIDVNFPNGITSSDNDTLIIDEVKKHPKLVEASDYILYSTFQICPIDMLYEICNALDCILTFFVGIPSFDDQFKLFLSAVIASNNPYFLIIIDFIYRFVPESNLTPKFISCLNISLATKEYIMKRS